MVGGRIVEVVEEEEVEGKVEEEEKDKEEEIVEVEEHPSGQGTASTDTSFPHFTITNRQHSLPLTCQTLFLSKKRPKVGSRNQDLLNFLYRYGIY